MFVIVQFLNFISSMISTTALRACKVSKAACGGVTHWLLTPDDDDPETGEARVMTVAWGQNAANGMLRLDKLRYG